MQNKPLNRFLIVGLCLTALSACGAGSGSNSGGGFKGFGLFRGSEETPQTTSTKSPPPAQSQPVATPAPEPAPEPEVRFLAEVLIGASMKSLESSLGEPDIIFAEQNARFLRYDAPGCAVHILMKEGRVIEVTPRKRNGRPLAKKAADDCFHAMVVARRAAVEADD